MEKNLFHVIIICCQLLYFAKKSIMEINTKFKPNNDNVNRSRNKFGMTRVFGVTKTLADEKGSE